MLMHSAHQAKGSAGYFVVEGYISKEKRYKSAEKNLKNPFRTES